MPCGTCMIVLRRCMLLPSMPPPSEPIGTRDMLSTPPATTSCCSPDMTPIAAKFTAWRPEPQKRFTVVPPTSLGPARVEHGVAREVRALLARLRDAADDHVVDVFGSSPDFFASPFERSARGAPAGGCPRARPFRPCRARAGCGRRRRCMRWPWGMNVWSARPPTGGKPRSTARARAIVRIEVWRRRGRAPEPTVPWNARRGSPEQLIARQPRAAPAVSKRTRIGPPLEDLAALCARLDWTRTGGGAHASTRAWRTSAALLDHMQAEEQWIFPAVAAPGRRPLVTSLMTSHGGFAVPSHRCTRAARRDPPPRRELRATLRRRTPTTRSVVASARPLHSVAPEQRRARVALTYEQIRDALAGGSCRARSWTSTRSIGTSSGTSRS